MEFNVLRMVSLGGYDFKKLEIQERSLIYVCKNKIHCLGLIHDYIGRRARSSSTNIWTLFMGKVCYEQIFITAT